MPEPDDLDPDIEALDLEEAAREAAYELKRQCPSVVFTSGRRTPARQAGAMAGNVVHNRDWIRQTYRENEASRACQEWVDDHPTATTADEIAAGLLEVMDGLSPDALVQLSRHLSGLAFDVQHVAGDPDGIKDVIRSLDGLKLFLDKEGGREIWHAQF